MLDLCKSINQDRKLRDMTLLGLESIRVDKRSWPFGNVVELCNGDEVEGYVVDTWFEFTEEAVMASEIARVEQIEKTFYDTNGIIFRDEERPWGKLNSLPTEFYAHQLLEVDTGNRASVHGFVRSWGLPFSPLRYSECCVCPSSELEERGRMGIERTNELGSRYSVAYAERIISFEEAAATIDLLQAVTYQLFAVILAEVEGRCFEKGFCSDPINAVSCNGLLLESMPSSTCTRPGYVPLGSLTSAIANQMIEVINDHAEWKICACDGCGKPFKHKQTERKNPDSKSIYCCQKCAERQRKRNQREAAKNRIRH